LNSDVDLLPKPDISGESFKHEDLTTLLKSVNNIYDTIEAIEHVEDYIPAAHSAPEAKKSMMGMIVSFFPSYPQDNKCDDRITCYTSLLGCPQSKSRLQVLFTFMYLFRTLIGSFHASSCLYNAIH
jgi:hypothetical protein